MVASFFAKVEWHFTGLAGWNLPGMLVLSVLLIAVVLCFVSGSSRENQEPSRKRTLPSSHVFHDRHAQPSEQGKRAEARIACDPVEVFIFAVSEPADTLTGYILNRSWGGVLVSTPQPFAQGTILRLHTPHNPKDLNWVHVEVRHCYQKEDQCLVGCKFIPKFSAAAQERRRAPRREGNPIAVLLSTDPAATAPVNGLVLNRSLGGLLVSALQPFEKGALLSVRPLQAPDELEWVQIEVRHCRALEHRWLVGCKFTKKLPWDVMLLFC
jgi:hypothetical protein